MSQHHADNSPDWMTLVVLKEVHLTDQSLLGIGYLLNELTDGASTSTCDKLFQLFMARWEKK